MRHARWVLFVASTASFSACSGDGGTSIAVDAAVPDAGLAAPADRAALFRPGPYTIGYRTASVTYRPAGVASDRTLKLDLWYPATAGTGTDSVYSVAGLIAVPRPGPRTDADVLANARFPVIVYSHGSGGVALAAFSYGEYFASWGFVFAAPDHTGNTALDRSNPIALNFLVRPQDISATLDWVLGDAASPVKGRTSDDIAAIGHSLGGYTVLSLVGARGNWDGIAASCSASNDGSCPVFQATAVRAKLDAGFLDPRFELAIAQAPVILTFAPNGAAAINRPVMMVTARRDQTLPWDVHGRPGWALLTGADDVWVDLLNAGHFSMVAVCDFVAPAILAAVGLNVIPDGCGPDFTPISELVPALTAYAHAFIRLHALGETRWRQIIGGDPFHPEITVTVGAH